MSNPKCLPMIPAPKKSLYLAFTALLGLTLFCLAGCSGTASRGDDSQSKAKPQEVETTERQEFEKKNRIIGNAKKEVQRIFGSWEKPDFALLITGRQHGYIEPCGCTGLENQKGGLLRRHTLSKTLESKGWNLVKIDAGNQVRRFGPQPEIKFKTTAKTLAEIFNYDAIGFGRDDLRLPAIELVSTMQNLEGTAEDPTAHPFLCNNVTIFADFADASFEEDKMVSTFKVIQTNGKKIAITAVLGEEAFDAIANEDLCLRKPDEGIEAVWPLMQKEKADANVLIAHTSLEDTSRLVKKYPHFDIVITAGGAGEPTNKPEEIKSGDHLSRVVQVGTKGMYAGVIGFYSDGRKFKYQRVNLSAAYEDSEEIKEVFRDYQSQVERNIFANLKDNMVPHPSGATFVGSAACADCHGDAHDVWKDGVAEFGDEVGPHTRATASLLEPNERNWVVRKFDPECLSCHATGWNPRKYYPYKSGYLDETAKHLHGNGCENCHGPGSLHVAAQENEEDVEKYQKMVRITLKDARQKCLECHDIDNSPDFHADGAFEKYWKRIDHSGMRE
ncbi:MAG: multiheme c-type cytochrome [Planctomycetota bacterium]|nr:multiheme c-type cytochrome [Planctomycetota bacterium]